MSFQNNQTAPDLSNMKCEIIDMEVKEEDCYDDPIQLNASNIFKYEDFQEIDGEIIDYGVYEEDEFENASTTLKPPSKPSLSSTAVSKPPILYDCKSKCVSIKVVDCYKYPWYYVKYKNQILERKHFEGVKDATDIVKSSRDSGCETIIDVDEYEYKDSKKLTKNEYDLETKRNAIEDTLETKLNINKCSFIKKSSTKSDKMPQRRSKTNSRSEAENTKSAINIPSSKIIDLKKNKGLVGMKVQKMVEENKIHKCIVNKKIRAKSKKSVKKQMNEQHPKLSANMLGVQYSKPSVNAAHEQDIKQTANFVELKKCESLRTQTSSDDLQKSKTLEAMGQNTNISISNDLEKCVSLKCSLKVPSPTMLRDLCKKKSIRHSEDLQKVKKYVSTNLNKDILKSAEVSNDYNKTNINSYGSIAPLQSPKDCDKPRKEQIEVPREGSHKNVSQCEPIPKSKQTENYGLNSTKAMNNQNIGQYGNLETKKFDTTMVIHSPNNSNNKDTSDNIGKNFAEQSLANNCESSNKSFMSMNKLTKKVLDMIQNSPKSSNKQINKNVIQKKNITNLHTDESNNHIKTKSNQATSSSVLVEKVSKQHPKTDISMNVRSDDKFVTTKNLLMTANKSNISQLTQNKKTDDDITRYLSKLVENEETETITNINSLNCSPSVSTVPPKSNNQQNKALTISHTLIINTENCLSKPLSGIITQPEKLAFEEMNYKNKQSLNITKGNQNNIETTHSLDAPLPKSFQPQGILPIQITDRSEQRGDKIEIKPTYMTINKSAPQRKQIPAILIRPINTNKNYVPNGFDTKRPNHICTPKVPSQTPKPLMSVPVNFPCSPPVRPRIPLKLVQPWKRPLYQQPIYPLSSANGYPPQRMPSTTQFQDGRNNYTQNNYMHQPHYSQMMSINRNMPPPRCNVPPNNVYRPYNYFPPNSAMPPPPPPQPLIQDNSHFFDRNSIIGQNTNGFIKKINITSSITNSTNTNTKKGKVLSKEKYVDCKESANASLDSFTPVSRKSDMIKELENAVLAKSPVKTELNVPYQASVKQANKINNTKPEPLLKTEVSFKPEIMKECKDAGSIESLKTEFKRPCNASEDQQTIAKNDKPGPLSKKLKFNDTVLPRNRDLNLSYKGYSPPILPIPTFQSILSDLNKFEKPLSLSNINGKNLLSGIQQKPRKMRKHPKEAKKNSLKKIPLSEFKEITKGHNKRKKLGALDEVQTK